MRSFFFSNKMPLPDKIDVVWIDFEPFEVSAVGLWSVGCLVVASTRLEARGPGGWFFCCALYPFAFSFVFPLLDFAFALSFLSFAFLRLPVCIRWSRSHLTT